MTTRLIDLLLPLTRRERWLLGGAGLVILLAIGFGLLMPLQDRHQQARTQLAELRALEQWIMARIGEKQGLTQGNTEISQAPIGTSGIEAGLIEAHLRQPLSALSAQEGGAIDLRFDRVDFIQLGQWLRTAHPAWGYRIDSFRLEALEGAAAAGRVAAWISLSPATQAR